MFTTGNLVTEPTTQQRRRSQTRQAILDAALELIEASGIDGWSMRELADKVDYTPGALYRYFDAKTSLLAALADDALAALRDRLLDVPAGESPIERLEGLGHAYLAYASDEPTRFRLSFIDLPSRRKDLDDPPPTNSAYAVLLDAVRDAIAGGSLSTTDGFGAEEIAFTFWATVHGMAVLEATHLRTFDADFDAIHDKAIGRVLRRLT